jgi:hypothetical protein
MSFANDLPAGPSSSIPLDVLRCRASGGSKYPPLASKAASAAAHVTTDFPWEHTELEVGLAQFDEL